MNRPDPIDLRARELFASYQPVPPAGAWAAIEARLAPTPERRPGVGWPLALVAVGLLLALAYGYLPAADMSPRPTPPRQPVSVAAVAAATAATDATSLADVDDVADEPTLRQRADAAVALAAPARTTPGVKQGRARHSDTARLAGSRPSASESPAGGRLTAVAAVATTDERAAHRATLPAGARPAESTLPVGGAPAVGADPVRAFESGLTLLTGERALALLPLPGRSLAAEIPCPDFGYRTAWGFALRLSGGGSPMDRDWDAVEAELQNYHTLRDTSETLRLNPTAALRLEAYHPSGFMARVGLDYRMERSELRARGPVTRTTTTTEVRDPLSGDVIRVDTNVTTSYTEGLTHNRHQRLAVVGGVGYRLPARRVWPYVVVEGGYGWLMAARGQLPRPLGDSELLEVESPYLRRTTGFEFGGTIGVDAALGARLRLGLSAHYRVLGSHRGTGDPLDFKQAAPSLALDLVVPL